MRMMSTTSSDRGEFSAFHMRESSERILGLIMHCKAKKAKKTILRKEKNLIVVIGILYSVD